jgi:hypothetical protein
MLWAASRRSLLDNRHGTFLRGILFRVWLPDPPAQPERNQSCVC